MRGTAHLWLITSFIPFLGGCKVGQIQPSAPSNQIATDSPIQQGLYFLKYKGEPAQDPRDGFLAKGKHLTVIVPRTVYNDRRNDEYEFIKRKVKFHIKNHSDKLLLLDFQEGDVTISSAVTSDSNYDNLGNHSPVNGIPLERGVYALHPDGYLDNDYTSIWKYLRKHESFFTQSPEVQLVCHDNSCFLLSFRLKYREAQTSMILEEHFDIPISTGQNWYYWEDMFKKRFGAQTLEISD